MFFWRDWVRIIGGLFTSIVRREVTTSAQRLGWLLVLGTIPVGIVGLLLEHTFRTVLSRPVPTAVFLVINGLILLGETHLRDPRVAGGAAPPGRSSCGRTAR